MHRRTQKGSTLKIRIGLIQLPYCARIRSAVVASILTLGAVVYVLALRQARHAQALQQSQFGRYTAQEAIELAKPILQAMLPDRSGLYVTAEPGEMPRANGQLQRVWNVDCIDSNGNYLVHMVRDAFTGTICWMGYDVIGCSASAHPISLSSQNAPIEAQRWMRMLGFMEEWHLISAEKHRVRGGGQDSRAWSLTLERPGWQAKLTIDERVGTLVYANIVPIR